MNWNELDVKLHNLQTKTITQIKNASNNYIIENIPKTDDSFKYDLIRYNKQTYKSPVVIAKLLEILDINGNIITEHDIEKQGLIVSLVLDKSSFYCKAGGQENDIGTIKTTNGKIFYVHKVEKINENGVILHYIKSKYWPILLKYIFNI